MPIDAMKSAGPNTSEASRPDEAAIASTAASPAADGTDMQVRRGR